MKFYIYTPDVYRCVDDVRAYVLSFDHVDGYQPIWPTGDREKAVEYAQLHEGLLWLVTLSRRCETRRPGCESTEVQLTITPEQYKREWAMTYTKEITIRHTVFARDEDEAIEQMRDYIVDVDILEEDENQDSDVSVDSWK